jgi:hypothetical protein
MKPSDSLPHATCRQKFADLIATLPPQRQQHIARLAEKIRAKTEAAQLVGSDVVAIKGRGRPLQ